MYKSLPYTMLQDDYLSRRFAQWLKGVFTPLLQRRMPTVYYSGFSHRFIPDFIRKYKKEYPYFVRVDLSRFYPSIPHKSLLVETQLAYKRLISHSFVPRRFKQEFLPQATAFLSRLPIEGVGLPLNSGVSKAWAPLVYVPLLMDIHKQYLVKYIAYVDDFLWLCKEQHTATEVYHALHNGFRRLGLQLQPQKVQSGRLGNTPVDFCGWRFAGGYASIQDEKVEQFRKRVEEIVRSYKNKPLHLLIKKINHQILGFGHFYKYGQVKRLYESLDVYISKTIYQGYLRDRVHVVQGAYKRYLRQNGLRELVDIFPQPEAKKKSPVGVYKKSLTIQRKSSEEEMTGIGYWEKMVEQQKHIIGLLKDLRNMVGRALSEQA